MNIWIEEVPGGSNSASSTIKPSDLSGVPQAQTSSIPTSGTISSGVEDVPITLSGPRKGHTKSRRGCYNCKRRRIKCHENHPICHACASRGLLCEWPEIQIRQVGADQKTLVHRKSSSPKIPMQMQSSRHNFGTLDFRLFHHFVESAYPHEPANNQSIWTHEIPIMASDHDYLMHAMLALAASDLISPPTNTSSKRSELMCAAISHRVKAISSLNEALSQGSLSFERGNAMLGTCYALVFQSVLIDDGLAEYMTFIRGIVLVSIQLKVRNLDFIFGNMFGEESFQVMEPRLKSAPSVDPDDISAACASLMKFYPLCQTESERNFHGLLFNTATGLLTSWRDGYLGLRNMYECFSYKMPNDDFQSFLDPSNVIGKLLHAHFIAIQLIMSPITRQEHPNNPNAENWTVRWMGPVCSNVSPQMWKFFEWPLAVAEVVKAKMCVKTSVLDGMRKICT